MDEQEIQNNIVVNTQKLLQKRITVMMMYIQTT